MCIGETAVALAVLGFNLGPQGFKRVLGNMGMESRSHIRKATEQVTKAKVLDTSKMAQ